jgi:hypothetical protein
MTRRNITEVRNPLLALPAVRDLLAFPPEVRAALAQLMRELSQDAAGKAEESWRRKKGPMAAYWKAVSVYAKHTGRVLRRASVAPRRTEAA